MTEIKEQIKNNLEFLSEQQLLELADFSAFLKIRSKIKNNSSKLFSSFSKYENEDKAFAELGMADYNSALLEEDKL
jgi:hypothetical protein